MSSNTLLPFQWPTIVLNGHPISFPVFVPVSFWPQNTSGCSPFYFVTHCPYHIIQNPQPYRPSIQHHSSWAYHGSPQSQDRRQRSSQDSKAIPVCIVCPQCLNLPKLPNHRFCSIGCSVSAARSAPRLTSLSPHHEFSVGIASRFMECWRSGPQPKLLGVYMVNWSETSGRRFEEYRNRVEARGYFKCMGCSSGNEQKQFRSTARACNLGENGNVYPCLDPDCWICETIRFGFGPHLRRKRSVPLNGSGIRLGAGIYTSTVSSKADKYARNIYDPDSPIRVMLVCRTVVGKPYITYREDPTLRQPPQGYDSVHGKSGSGSCFTDDEYVFYDEDALRPAYLVVYEKDGH